MQPSTKRINRRRSYVFGQSIIDSDLRQSAWVRWLGIAVGCKSRAMLDISGNCDGGTDAAARPRERRHHYRWRSSPRGQQLCQAEVGHPAARRHIQLQRLAPAQESKTSRAYGRVISLDVFTDEVSFTEPETPS